MAKRTFRTLRERTQHVESKATTKGSHGSRPPGSNKGSRSATTTASRVVGGRRTARRG